jgi:hypothetical protein
MPDLDAYRRGVKNAKGISYPLTLPHLKTLRENILATGIPDAYHQGLYDAVEDMIKEREGS